MPPPQIDYKSLVLENTAKNVLIFVIIFATYFYIEKVLSQIKDNQIGNFLSLISILLVTASFTNFAFTYEKSRMHLKNMRLLSHAATFILMLLTALLLESMVISVGILYPVMYPLILTFSVLLYSGIILYDFWDLFRV